MTIPSIPPELELKRCNDTPDITAAASVVDQYIPIPDFKPEPSPGYSTTIVSAFFPPPQAEVLVRRMGGDPFTRDPDEYVQALKLMARICKKLVLFVPPGCMAEDLRAAAPDVIVYDHYRTVWEMPHLAPHQDEFYTHQPTRSLHGGCRNPTNLYGEPHSWGAWNAKAFLILEALRLDPFRTSHFVWMDARVPSFIPRSHTADWIWPHPEALERAHSVMPAEDRVVLSTMRPLRPPGAEYWPRLLADGTKMDAYMSDLHAVVANVYFGAKAAMARLARAQLILMQRDLARGNYPDFLSSSVPYAN